ncbi:putative chy zinc finger domain protein [Phaeomoniella chlamydospora]|uniref:Putative chy zinc finger domain protein n=1 Tax=Phaeomoniella chlamydospora TaxID=158046 RepID=A0A0G2EYU6_PHACM|nr:putative chy zinc finger domain protein [Phaeomoniella chlamydospora]
MARNSTPYVTTPLQRFLEITLSHYHIDRPEMRIERERVIDRSCRAGETCPFLHDAGLSKGPQQGSKDKVLPEPTGTAVVQDEGGANNSQSKTAASLSRPNVVRKTQVMSKPISNAEKSNPREFQLSQIRRRFTPSEKTDEQNAAILSFKMKPSDPDFPFELEALLCTLIVPANYPHGANGKPRLRVTNPEMERGYQINVERGFDALISKSPGKTLLALMNDLERNLESYLIPEKAQTIKLISNAHQTEAAARPAVRAPVATPTSSSPPTLVASKPVKQPVLPVRPSPSYTASQRAEAEARRTAHLRQLEARMGRQQMFSKASDGVTFTVPIVPKSPSLLPVSLQTVKAVKLVVPMSYNLEPSRIEMVGVERGAEALRVEKAFEKRAQDNPDMNLMTQLNLLGVNMHMMAKEEQKTPSTPVPTPTEPEMISIARMRSRTPPPESSGFGEFDNDDRSHVKIIPRPPEWNQHHHDSPDDNDEDTYSDTYDSEADVTGSEDEDGGVNVLVNETEPAPERGVLLSFPFLELYGIELLELTSLSLTVKCDRCKDMKDIKNLRSRSAEQANVKNESCNKCASLLSVGYRKDLMHVSSVKAGYLDLDGCTVVDLLPRLQITRGQIPHRFEYWR